MPSHKIMATKLANLATSSCYIGDIKTSPPSSSSSSSDTAALNLGTNGYRSSRSLKSPRAATSQLVTRPFSLASRTRRDSNGARQQPTQQPPRFDLSKTAETRRASTQLTPRPPMASASRLRRDFEKMFLQTLKAVTGELHHWTNDVINSGKVHNAMSETYYSAYISQMSRALTFKAQWDDTASTLTTQQATRMEALVNVVGYVYLFNSMDPHDSETFGTDCHRLDMILMKLQKAACILVNLLPEVDIEKEVLNSYIPNSYAVSFKAPKLRQFEMGLALQDISQTLNDMTFDIPNAKLKMADA